MKYYYLISLLFIGFGHLGFAQHNFLFERKTLKETKLIEDSLSSKYIGPVKTQVSKDYFPTAKANHDYYPITYIRTNDSFFPELHVEYFYNESDSTLLATSYDWNIMSYVKNLKTDGDKFEIEIKRKKEYLNKYNTIKSELVKKYGEPTSIEETKNGEGFFYRLRWDNEVNDVLVLLKFSTQLKTLPGNMKLGSYNIRVKIDYK
jgi:hypothetical protein